MYFLPRDGFFGFFWFPSGFCSFLASAPRGPRESPLPCWLLAQRATRRVHTLACFAPGGHRDSALPCLLLWQGATMRVRSLLAWWLVPQGATGRVLLARLCWPQHRGTVHSLACLLAESGLPVCSCPTQPQGECTPLLTCRRQQQREIAVPCFLACWLVSQAAT